MAARLNLPTTGWQVERRNALVLARRARDKAMRERQYAHADAWLWTAMDLEQTLRERAAACITEGTEMRFAHDHFDAPLRAAMLAALPATTGCAAQRAAQPQEAAA